MKSTAARVHGTGLGFRRDLVDSLLQKDSFQPAFLEFAPENWMNIGGFWGKMLREATARYPIACHGLSLSLGSPEPLDRRFLKDLKKFFKEVKPFLYSEHLSFTKCGNAH